MNANEFRRILTSFADSPADVDVAKGRVLVQIRDEVIVADLEQREGTLFVSEDGVKQSAFKWIVDRVARLSVLADRILANVAEPDYFVASKGQLEDELSAESGGRPVDIARASDCVRQVLGRRAAGTSLVLYLTSDAGEGKTTLINHVARQQALGFKRKETDWLLVPVPLGGRPFLRFDDVVIGALVNRLRFQFFYYDAFLELVKLGVIVPAFDGFEEMFVESSSGEALSALGNLVSSLDSSGRVLISARKAYFEYRSFAAQARLFDAVGRDAVSFARIALNRWTRNQFLDYATKRGVAQAAEVFDLVSARFNQEDHPVLSRAVLVKRLLDVASTASDLQTLLGGFDQAPEQYFHTFVNAIIEREVRDKWIDRSGEPHRPLLTVSEHHELLSFVAQEMWLSSSEVLKAEMLDTVADLFSEARGKSPVVTRQIRERLKQHSLIATADASRNQFSFDHEDFRLFFLGQALGRVIAEGSKAELLAMLRVATLPGTACEAAVALLRRTKSELNTTLVRLQDASKSDAPTSFTRENCGAVAIRVLDSDKNWDGVTIEGMVFPSDALQGRQLRNVAFVDCYFYTTSLDHADFDGVTFRSCRFEELETSTSMRFARTRLEDSEVRSVAQPNADARLFDPSAIRRELRDAGFEFDSPPGPQELKAPLPDERSRLSEKVFRLFLRANQLNEDVFVKRFGVRAGAFADEVLPELLRSGVFEEVKYLGAGRQRRFRLALAMADIEAAMRDSKGNFEVFIAMAGQKHRDASAG